MAENRDDKWIDELLAKASARPPIKDAGFSKRVMARIPGALSVRAKRLAIQGIGFLVGLGGFALSSYAIGSVTAAGDEVNRLLSVTANANAALSDLSGLLSASNPTTVILMATLLIVVSFVVADQPVSKR